MILVPVRQEYAADHVFMFDEIADLGEYEVDARHLLRREDDARVDDNDVAPVFDRGHVLADLAHAAEEQNFHGRLFARTAFALLRLLTLSVCALLCLGALLCRLLFARRLGARLYLLFRSTLARFALLCAAGRDARALSLCARGAAGGIARLLHRLFAAFLSQIFGRGLCLLLLRSLALLLLCLIALVCRDPVENGKFDGVLRLVLSAFFFVVQMLLLLPPYRVQSMQNKRVAALCMFHAYVRPI